MKNRFISIKWRSFFFFLMVFSTLVNNLQAQPQFTWAQKLNGSSTIKSHEVDASGNIYCSGFFNGSIDFDNSTSDTFVLNAEFGNGFVMKLTTTGIFLWAVQFQVQHPPVLALDNEGNVYVSANSHGTNLLDLDPGPGEVLHENQTPGLPDVFVVKLDANGNYIWGKAFGSYKVDNLNDIETDHVKGGVYLLGNFYGSGDFDPGPDTLLLETLFTNQIRHFILRLDKDGDLAWAYSTGSILTSIESNKNPGVFITGYYTGDPDFSPGVDTLELGTNSPAGFILNLSAEGYFLGAKPAAFPTGLTATHCYVYQITFDTLGNLYMWGDYAGDLDFDIGPGVYKLPYAQGYNQIFLSKYDPTGKFIWAIGYSWPVSVFGINIDIMNADAHGNLYLGGRYFETLDFDAGPMEHILIAEASYSDAFILKLLPDGQFDWAFRISGGGTDFNAGLTIDNNYQLIASGQFSGNADFDPGPAIKSLSGTTYRSAYLAKYKVPNTAVSQPELIETFSVYPNPANDWIQLPADVEGKTFTVYNEMGALSKTGTLSGLDGKIGIGNLPEGYYTVCIDGAKKRHVGKFLKRRG